MFKYKVGDKVWISKPGYANYNVPGTICKLNTTIDEDLIYIVEVFAYKDYITVSRYENRIKPRITLEDVLEEIC